MNWQGWKQLDDLYDGRKVWVLRDDHGRGRAMVWGGVWHTFDERGRGGENDVATDCETARFRAEAAIVRQGWATNGDIHGRK